MLAALSFSPVARHPLRHWPESLPEGVGVLVLQGRGQEMCLPRVASVTSGLVASAEGSAPTQETCVTVSHAWWGLLPGVSGRCSQGAVRGRDRAGSGDEGERHQPWQPGALLPTHSPHPSPRSWKRGLLCGVICDPSCTHNLGLCPTEAWELPSTPKGAELVAETGRPWELPELGVKSPSTM